MLKLTWLDDLFSDGDGKPDTEGELVPEQAEEWESLDDEKPDVGNYAECIGYRNGKDWRCNRCPDCDWLKVYPCRRYNRAHAAEILDAEVNPETGEARLCLQPTEDDLQHCRRCPHWKRTERNAGYCGVRENLNFWRQ